MSHGGRSYAGVPTVVATFGQSFVDYPPLQEK